MRPLETIFVCIPLFRPWPRTFPWRNGLTSGSHLFLLPSDMASTLCVKPRLDVRIDAGLMEDSNRLHEAEQSLQVAQLVRLMRATCLDVAESATNSDVQLANSTICVARAVKLIGAQNEVAVERVEVEGLPAELEHMTWGKVVQYRDNPFNGFNRQWTQDCDLVSHLNSTLNISLTSECSRP